MRTAVIIAVALLALSAVSLSIVQAEEAGDDVLLVDYGNGRTIFSDIGSGTTYGDAMASAASSAGVEVDADGLTVDGIGAVTTGGVTASWRVYSWDGEWRDVTSSFDPDAAYPGGSLALGYYPEGTAPVETPDSRSSWTMTRGDSANTGAQSAELSSEEGSLAWAYTYGSANYVNATVLSAGDRVFVVAGGGYTSTSAEPTLYCYDRFTGEELWKYTCPRGVGYETATGAIVGEYIYLPATNGTLYRIPLDGPGEDGSGVISLDIPKELDHDLTGMAYSTGPASIVCDSGVLYFGSSNGYIYCVSLDLEVLWKTAIGGRVYYTPMTVVDGVVYAGALDGSLYVLDARDGAIIDSEEVFTITRTSGGAERVYGAVNAPVVVDGIIMFTFSDGQGMNSTQGGLAAYRLTSDGLEEVFKSTDPGLSSNTVLPVVSDGFTGVYFTNLEGVCRISTGGTYEVLADGLGTFRGPITLVNSEYLYVQEYDRGGNVYVMDMGGSILASMAQPELVEEFCMSPLVIIDGMVYVGTDGGSYAWSGAIPAASQGGGEGVSVPWAAVFWLILLIVIVAFVAYCIHIKRSKGVPPIAYIRGKLRERSGFSNERTSKVGRNKRRLVLVIFVGLAIGFVLFLTSLAYGPSGNYTLGETFSYLGSAIGKTLSGEALDFNETIIFDSRCSRAVAAFAAGVGLSIAGSVYQAIIRNPMVDPYIMGVSAGAGVAAVATIAFNFTFFGLLDNVTYATPIVAMVGGVVAFGMTMLLAERAGGSSINYVLAGVIVGLVFSAVQTLLLSMAGDKLNDVMSWLFGSFANIDWDEAILMSVPAIALSLVPLVWAKEFNLVLLGEDQARQMGLDVRRFNRWMLILASVLASLCVAFVGIIGFVGLVVPHLCRMILGGDHRLVMPASIVVGGALMLAADLFAKMVMVPMELPVGAITTVIGAPVFAYLLIRKGRMYDG